MIDHRRILFVSDHGYLPEITGGRERSIHELSVKLSNAGHHVAVLVREGSAGQQTAAAGFATELKTRSRRLLSLPFQNNWRQEYPIYRSRSVESTMNELIERHSYDFAVLQFDRPHRKIDFHVSAANRYVVYIRDAKDIPDMHSESFPDDVPLIANSAFTARKVSEKTGRRVSTLIPYVEKELYTTTPQGRFVTFINPVPDKGVDLAIAIAESCPDIPFLFVECWLQSATALRRLKRSIASVRNITLKKAVMDMREIYSQTRVLLVPSQWEESWARVVTESHFSAIPVVASDIGGLTESVGQGGILIPPTDTVDTWAEALRNLYTSSTLHSELSARAQQQSEAYWSKAQGLPSAFLQCCVSTDRDAR